MQNEVYIHGYNEPPPIPEKPAKVEEVKVYKIRHRKTGKYSSGTRWPHWSDNGKEWKTLGALG
ncbi:hypothetical protein ACQUET_13355, partial [Lactococcus lactis]|uniref:hypothetical protein n=1 Tax=Lactococcus lactis TaxID=1358 RepID=UPI003D0BCCE9